MSDRHTTNPLLRTEFRVQYQNPEVAGWKGLIYVWLDLGYLAYDRLKFALGALAIMAALLLFGNGAEGWAAGTALLAGGILFFAACKSRTDEDWGYKFEKRHRFLGWLDWFLWQYAGYDGRFLDNLLAYREQQHRWRQSFMQLWCAQNNEDSFPVWTFFAPYRIASRRLSSR